MTDLGDISAGRALSAARKKKRLRYKKLSSELNIDESYLVALEEDNFELIPGGEAYVKGFLRSYAKKLELNPDEIIQIYSSAREKTSDKISGNLGLQIKKDNNQNILLKVVDEGQGFKEKDTDKIFKRFYSNRPEKFGQHSGLGLNIVKNLVDLHGGSIKASNNLNQKGANVEIIFPKS